MIHDSIICGSRGASEASAKKSPSYRLSDKLLGTKPLLFFGIFSFDSNTTARDRDRSGNPAALVLDEGEELKRRARFIRFFAWVFGMAKI